VGGEVVESWGYGDFHSTDAAELSTCFAFSIIIPAAGLQYTRETSGRP
jgi:hypothetical protein